MSALNLKQPRKRVIPNQGAILNACEKVIKL